MTIKMNPKNTNRLISLRNIIVVLLIAAAAYFAYRHFKPNTKIKNVLLISIDTCRADHLSCYGYPEKTTPNIDILAAEGVMFEHVFTPVPLTLPAHTSMLTGTNPIYHGVHSNIGYIVGESNQTLAELMRQKGFVTGAVISSFVLDSQFGLNQGFDVYEDKFVHPIPSNYHNERRGDETSSFANAFLDKYHKKPFFLFVHYYDPHDLYNPPEPFATLFKDNLYAGEIAFADTCIGEVIKKLKELGLYESTLIIITADHGESLEEHKEKTHGFFIYQSVLHVPLIIRLPGGPKGKKVIDNASLIDIVPTVCSLLDIKVPAAAAGKSLLPYLRGNTMPKNEERYIYCESLEATQYGCNPLLGVVNNNWKYIHTTRAELYDLDKDPNEQVNLVTEFDKRARLLQGQLDLILEQQKAADKSTSKTALNRETRKRLESLGYLGGSSENDNLDFDANKVDAKDYIHLHDQITWIRIYFKLKNYDKAQEFGKTLFSEPFPGKLYGYLFLGEIAIKKGDYAEAIHNLTEFLSIVDQAREFGEKYLSTKDHICQVYHNLGLAYAEEKNFDKAMSFYLKAVEIDPNPSITYYNMGNLYLRQNKNEEAEKYYIKALNLDPQLAEAHYDLGLVYSKKNQLQKAIYHYQEAIKLKPDWQHPKDRLLEIQNLVAKINQNIKSSEESLLQNPNQPELHKTLATLFYQQDNINDAMNHWESALKLDPNDAMTLNNLAYIYATQSEGEFKNPQKAVQIAERACKLTDYKDPVILDTLSIAYAASDRNFEAIETAKKALALAVSSENQKLADEIRGHLKNFQKNNNP
jgi:arylsulfatase A-like enzyme/Flp pilus assembly protein TadD